jgi:putative endopeptidase
VIKVLRVALPALRLCLVWPRPPVRPSNPRRSLSPRCPTLPPSISPAWTSTIDPCVNFYQYACGGWKKLNPIPADQATWDVYSKLANDNQQFLWGILEQDAKATDRTPIQQKVGDYFESCMNQPAINAAGDQPIQPALARIEALKTRPELLAAIASLHHDTPGNYFFRSSTGQDAVDSSTIIVEVGAGGLGLPDRDYYLKTDPKSVKLRAEARMPEQAERRRGRRRLRIETHAGRGAAHAA